MMGRKRYRLQCQRCGGAFWTLYPTQSTCSRSCSAQERCRTHGLLGLKPGARPRVQHGPPESTARVEELLRQATAARRYRDAVMGRRTYTTDGWEQRAGAAIHHEGENEVW